MLMRKALYGCIVTVPFAPALSDLAHISRRLLMSRRI